MKLFYVLLLILNFSLFAEEKLAGQEIIEKLDQVLKLKEGHTSATLSIKRGNHETHFWKVNIFKEQDDVLYTFEITHRKPVAKFFSIKKGRKLIYYNVLSGKLFQIVQLEKLDSILHTSFSYLDISNYQYEENYKSEDIKKVKAETSESTIVKMTPVFQPSYKHLDLYVNSENYQPKKIDFISSKGLLMKTMKFKFGNLKVREGKSLSEIPSLVRLEMTDNSTNYTSILEFKEWNKNINPSKEFYKVKSMYEKN